MNKIILLGRLTKDPEFKTLEESNLSLCKFTLAVRRVYRKETEEKEGVDFIPVVFFGRRAEIINEYLKKGNLLSVSGRLQLRSYEDKEGVKRHIAEVIGDEFQFVSSKNPETGAM